MEEWEGKDQVMAKRQDVISDRWALEGQCGGESSSGY